MANVLTMFDASRMYIAVLTFYEPLYSRKRSHSLDSLLIKKLSNASLRSSTNSSSQPPSPPGVMSQSSPNLLNTGKYGPKCICILSRYPFFSTFESFLTALFTLSLAGSTVPIERYISMFIEQPITNNMQVKIPIGQTIITCSIPANKDLEVADFSFKYLFDTLDVGNIVTILSGMLTEQKIVFLSKEPGLLTYVMESLLSLLYPFCWPYIYIPVLPVSLKTFLEAPTPFLIGTVTGNIELAEFDTSQMMMVFLDTNKVMFTGNLPKIHDEEILIHSVRKILHPSLYNVGRVFQDENRLQLEKHVKHRMIRQAFLNYFANIFRNWRDYLIVLEDKNSQVETSVGIFNKASFLKSWTDDVSGGLSEFLSTYIFDLFIEEYAENTNSVFDITIAKRNGNFAGNSSNPAPTVVVMDHPTLEGVENQEVFNYHGVFPSLNSHWFGKKVKEELSEAPNVPMRRDSLKKSNGMGFDFDMLTRAANGVTPSVADVSVYLMQTVIDKILIRGTPLDFTEISQITNLFKDEQSRRQFTHLLYEQKQRKSSSVLGPSSYNILAQLMNTAIEEAEQVEDFMTCKILMILGSVFCLHRDSGGTEFIRNRIKGRSIWKVVDFWLYCVKDDLKSHESSQEKEITDQDREHVIFGLAVNMSYNMLNLEIPDGFITSFVNRLCSEYHISEEQSESLRSMTRKMFKFCGNSEQEETPMMIRRAGSFNKEPNKPVVSLNSMDKKLSLAKSFRESFRF
eukprot:TRINITY_DN4546_c0_g2_i2.p1 TRINITY_DN4546_c0_g2~~TRINITY_DN4546_c0_g2_i2.p1  ORF type:complete len:842 (+),score=247.37 TRINITY_DN4546_c0_g2_i2:312-2528(+)